MGGLDLGGIHEEVQETVYLDDHVDSLGLEIGKTVYLNIFFAERAFSSSNFMITTNIQLNEDACVEYERVLLRGEPVINSLPSAITWEGELVQPHDTKGMPVKFSFGCIEGEHCHTQQVFEGLFPAVNLDPWHTMPLSLEITDRSGGELELSQIHITFYNLEHGMTVRAAGSITGYTFLSNSYIRYSKDGPFDVFESEAPLHGTVPAYPDELTEEQKQKSFALTFSSLQGAQIILKNFKSDSQSADFRFTMVPMFNCVPCYPPCPENEPLAQTMTTTTTFTSTTTTTTTFNLGMEAASADEGAEEDEYSCCFIDQLGFRLSCHSEKQWWIPWCPGEAKWPWDKWPWE